MLYDVVDPVVKSLHSNARMRGLLVADVGSFFAACRFCSNCGTKVSDVPWQVVSKFLDQGSHQHPQHWKADSQPLDHQESLIRVSSFGPSSVILDSALIFFSRTLDQNRLGISVIYYYSFQACLKDCRIG